MSKDSWHFYAGAILNPQSDTACNYLPHGLLAVRNGLIESVLSYDFGLKKYKHLIKKSNFVEFNDAVMMPGFFDMHFHWVQDDVREMPKDSLIEWLEKYTFPAEMKFSNKAYTKQKAKIFFKRLTQVGTIGGACYSSIHQCALESAMNEAKGDFVIGNVNMNINSPEKLTQSEEQSITLTKKLTQKYGKRYCFTPRFALTTTPDVMSRGSKIADKAKCFKQTHLAETPQEIEMVLSTIKQFKAYKDVSSYTDVYYKTGMLGKNSLMGHAIHLSKEELSLLKKTNTALIHCPTSNAPIEEHGLDSGLFDFKLVERFKIRWALGSDIGGGPFLSMFDVMRSFVFQNQRQNQRQNQKQHAATYVKALYRSTLAGAEILNLAKKVGNFARGKDASFNVVPLKKPQTYTHAEQTLEAIIRPLAKKRHEYDSLIKFVYLKNKLVKK